MRWDRYNNGGAVIAPTPEAAVLSELQNKPHSQIDEHINNADMYAPIKKIQDLISVFPAIADSSLINFIEMAFAGGDTLDINDFNPGQIPSDFRTLRNISEHIKYDPDISYGETGDRLNKYIHSSPDKAAAALEFSKQNYNKGGKVQKYNNGGAVNNLKYPAFNMPSDRSPSPPMPVNPQTPKVPPMPNLGNNPNSVVQNKFRPPKRKTPPGVPNPKPYSPFSQSMNTLG